METRQRTFLLRVSALVALTVATAAPAVAAPVVATASTTPAVSPSWQFRPTVTHNTLISVDVVNRAVIWAAGGGFQPNDGTVVRTVDGGRSWQNVTPPDGASQVFRDVEAFDRDHALVLAIGGSDAGRIYRTADGGATWRLVFRNGDPRAFWDCMAFFDDSRGLAVSDSVEGKFPILATVDGGRTWHLAPTKGMPAALPSEGARATGTCLVTAGRDDAWFGTTVSAPNARVFHTGDGGRTWTVAVTPIPGEPAGIVSLSFRDHRHGLAIGGDPPPPFGSADVGVVALSSDGGSSWSLGGAPAGYRNSVAWTGRDETAVVVGFHGSDLSTDGGRTWTLFDRRALLGVDCLRDVECWAVGEAGMAARLTLRRH